MESSNSGLLIRKKFLRSQFESPQQTDNFSLQNFEEMDEVSLQLAMIRKKYDILKQENSNKRRTLERLTKELETISLLTNVHSDDHSLVESTLNILSSNLEAHRKKLEEELSNKKTYKHIYDRINEEKISLELKSNELHSQLKSSSQILDTEKGIYRKKFEVIHSSRTSLKNLKQAVSFENKKKLERISSLEKTMSLRKEAAERREERIRKIAEIADIAANENTNSQEISLKQSLLLHKIWFSYLKYKLDKKLKGAIEIEDAYQKIRSATGLQNISEIVKNFVGKEESHAQLRKSIEEANKTLDELKMRNEQSKVELKQLMLIEGNSNAIEFLRNTRKVNEEINEEKKFSENLTEENRKYQEFYDEIVAWGNKTQKSFGLDQKNLPIETIENCKNRIQQELLSLQSNKEEFVKEWNKTDRLSSEIFLKSVYHENYRNLSSKVKKSVADPESDEASVNEEKRKKVQKKVKLAN